MNVLTNTDIKNILDHYKIKLNAIDQKDKIVLNKPGYYIINIQSSKEGSGTHWTALIYNPEKSYFFDAYGFPPPDDIELLLPEYEYNMFDIQNINSSSCGFYCIAFLKFMNSKKDKESAFKAFLNLFKRNTIQNENILDDILKA